MIKKNQLTGYKNDKDIIMFAGNNTFQCSVITFGSRNNAVKKNYL